MRALGTTITLSDSHASAWVSPASRSKLLPSAIPRLTRSAGDLFRQLRIGECIAGEVGHDPKSFCA